MSGPHFNFATNGYVLSTACKRVSWVRLALPRSGDMLRHWAERRRQRRALRDLDDRLLHDIGISRAAARDEAAKPFWR